MNRLLKYIGSGVDTFGKGVFGIILETRGSTPQVPGASAIFSPKGIFAGTLGGGVLEFEASNKALEIIESGTSILFEYELNSDISESKGAICGGLVTLLLDSGYQKDTALFREVEKSLNEQLPGLLITSIEKSVNNEVTVTRHWYTGKSNLDLNKGLPGRLTESEAEKAFETRVAAFIEKEETSYFLEPLFPVPQLVIVGAGHIGHALSHICALLDFSVTIIDDRREIATKERFPDADRIIVGDVGESVANLKVSGGTYIVIMTPGHSSDATALRQCISSEAAYIGMIGSKRKIALMREQFIKQGWATVSQFDKIHAPIGIPIPSDTVQEIAISIAAELIVARKESQEKSRKKKICTLVLAAGESTRMKKQKLLLPFGEKSMIENVVSACIGSKSDLTTVVLGANHKEVEDKLTGLKVAKILNKNFQEGMLTSVKSGITSLSKDVSATIISLGDQPMIKPGIINTLIDSYLNNQKGIIIPAFKGRRGHPLLVDSKYFSSIIELKEDQSLRTIIQENPDDILQVEVKEDWILRDIDTCEEYENEIKQIDNEQTNQV